MSNNKITKKVLKIFFISIFISIIFVLTTAASGKIVVVDEDLSYVIDHNTGEKFLYKDFRGKEVIEGHELEFVIILRLLDTAPDNSVLNSRTTLLNSKWEFEGKIYQAAEVNFDISNRPAESVLKLELSCLTPKGEVEVEEPIFHYLHRGIGKKEIFVENALYKFQDEELSLIEPIDKLLFFSVHPDFNNVLRQIEEDLNSSAVKYENPEYLEVLIDLAKKGHPGWAKEISEDLKMLEPKAPPLPSSSPDWIPFILLILLLAGIPSAIFGGIIILKRRYRKLPEELEKTGKSLSDCDANLKWVRDRLAEIDAPDNVREKVRSQIEEINIAEVKVRKVKDELERI